MVMNCGEFLSVLLRDWLGFGQKVSPCNWVIAHLLPNTAPLSFDAGFAGLLLSRFNSDSWRVASSLCFAVNVLSSAIWINTLSNLLLIVAGILGLMGGLNRFGDLLGWSILLPVGT